MPTYEYKCSECGYKFELFQKITDNPATECPQCKGMVKRLISTGAGTIFKGSGFYQTDYKNKTKNPNGGETVKPKTESKKNESAVSKPKS